MIEDPDLTAHLERWAKEGREGLDEIFPRIYDEMHSLARIHLGRYGRGRSEGVTLQPTVLVHEAYLRLSEHSVTPFANRQEFFAFASKVIRHVLVDHVRNRSRVKRGGELERIPLESVMGRAETGGLDPSGLLGLDQALRRLQSSHPEQARVVEMRFFGGLTHSEIAEVSGVSLATVERQWSIGKRRLAHLLSR